MKVKKGMKADERAKGRWTTGTVRLYRDDSAPRELVWLLNLPGQVTPRWHPQLLLCEPDIEDEQELLFVQTHGAGLFKVGVRIYESGGKRGWSDTPFGRVVWIPI
jgi:hypothetical protein